MRVIQCLVPGSCPDLPDGPPVSLIKGNQHAGYVAHYGALPPHWGEERRQAFEALREDSVMLLWREGKEREGDRRLRDNAVTWLRRYGLDSLGRPLVWGHTETPERDSPLAMAG